MGILASIVISSIYLFWFRKTVTKRYVVLSILFVLYLSIAISDVVGFPSLPEFNRLARVGDYFFNPDINWLPFSAGVDFSSVLNIVFFIPLGVFLPVMWNTFKRLVPTFILGFVLSIIIEIGQLFTLYRVTDINDVIMNTAGVILGWVLAKYIFKFEIQRKDGNNYDWFIFILIVFLSCFLLG